MDRHEPLTDAALDRAITAALSAEPSPEFVTRARQRIANEPRPLPAWFRAGWVALGSAALIAMTIVVGVRSRPRDAGTEPQTAPLASRSLAISTEARAPAPTPHIERRTTRPAPINGVAVGPVRSPAPELLLEPGETAALRRIVRGGRGTRVDPMDLADAAANAAMPRQGDGTLAPIPDLMPIDVQPLAPLTREEGVRQ